MSRGFSKPFHTKTHYCVFVTREDALDFSEVLRKNFPRIRFVRQDFAAKYLDVDAWRQAGEEAKRKGRARPRQLDFTRDPFSEGLDYFPSLADVLERNFCVWVEPPNWRPRWRLRRREDVLVLENKPRLRFEFWRGGFYLGDGRRRDGLHGDPHQPLRDLDHIPDPIDRKEPIYLEGHTMWGAWTKGADDEKQFIHRVWRLFDKMTTNRLVAVDRAALTPIPPDGSATVEQYVRAAPDALSWARARRHNYLSWGGALFKPEAYFKWYRPEENEDGMTSSARPHPRKAKAVRSRKKRSSRRR